MRYLVPGATAGRLKTTMPVHSPPFEEYTQRLKARQAAVARCSRLHRILAGLRLFTAVTFIVTLWLVAQETLVPAWLILAPTLIFVGLAVYHGRILRRARRSSRAVEFYERGLARIEGRWLSREASGTTFADEAHPYATGLDIFGRDSLFGLVSTARTRAGEETLARWLSGPASRNEILERQNSIEELRNNIDLREDLAILGRDVRTALHPERMTEWGRSPVVLEYLPARIVAPILAGLVYYTQIDYWFRDGSGLAATIALVVTGGFGLFYRNRVRKVVANVEQPARELEILSQVFARLEKEDFRSKRLRELRGALDTDGHPPSKEVGRLVRLIDLLNSRLNQLFMLFAALMLWSTQVSFAIEAWRRRCGPSLGRWLDAIGEFEALCALAGYAYEHPEDPFPEIVEDETCFEGDDLRHPLLPRDRCVPNTVRLGQDLQLLVVSGSNMSGKSTLLRTIGVNVVLALAGAPVRAARLRLSPLALGATLHIQDSLQAGSSHFYAEIRRLKDIMELTEGPIPVMFLLDEILHGTNSHDRAIGAESVVRSLVERGAIGLVTTHDLALAKVADALAPTAANVHFQDHLEDGQMVFDYRLHPGVVERSNALDLMRAVGLNL
jgi:hypothetical protein